MTTLEALKANVADVHGLVISANNFLKCLVDEGLTGSEIYTKTDYEKTVDLSTIRVYRLILGNANLNEGSVSYSVANKDYIKSVIDNLLIKWDYPSEFNTRPMVRRANPW